VCFSVQQCVAVSCFGSLLQCVLQSLYQQSTGACLAGKSVAGCVAVSVCGSALQCVAGMLQVCCSYVAVSARQQSIVLV